MANAFILLLVAYLFSLSVFIIGFKEYYKKLSQEMACKCGWWNVLKANSTVFLWDWRFLYFAIFSYIIKHNYIVNMSPLQEKTSQF